MKKIIKILIYSSIIEIFLLSSAYGLTGEINNIISEESKSIKELNESIDKLNETHRELNKDFQVLNNGFKLKSFFKEYLAKSEIKDIEYLIKRYIGKKNALEAILEEKASNFEDTSEEKKSLLNEKKAFYKSILPFIKKEKINEYLNYIEHDVKIFKDKKDVFEKIIINNEIVDNKVEKIEKSIIEHRKYLNNKFDILINEILTEKINALLSNEKYKSLTTSQKRASLEKIIINIEGAIKDSENIADRTDALSKKIEVYNTILEKFKQMKEDLVD